MRAAQTSTPHLTIRRAALLALAFALPLAGPTGALAQAIDAETLVDEHRVDGCSRSTGRTHTETSLHLELGPAGAAELTLESTSRSAIRSASRGAGGRITSSASVTGAHERHVWSGRARTGAGGTLLIDFDQVKVAEVNWTGHGSLPLPTARTEQVQLRLRCAPRPLDVYPPAPSGQLPHVAGGGERPTRSAGLTCRLDQGSAYVLSRLGEIPFAKAIPITRFVSALFRADESLLRRRR